MRGQRRVGVVAILAVTTIGVLVPSAEAEDPDPNDAVTALVRQVCDVLWIDGLCEDFAYPDPGYRTDVDPSPDQPLALRIGAVHEHSGYSDGDPTARPVDYFDAARTGHNVVDGGSGDSGVIVDFVLSSEHSENEKLPITTAEVCLDPSGIPDALADLDVLAIPPLPCANVGEGDHYDKWDETLLQAASTTEVDDDGAHTGFTAMRGFEWTNDYYNHLGVYFSRNVVNAKIDGSYLTMDFFWNWLREPAETGGGSDALVVFNHPGKLPALTPFDGDLPHNQILAATLGGANWNDLTYIPDVDDRVVGIEVNGDDDLSWYLKALTNGWHLGPMAAEDEHQREWSSTGDGKTLILTRGRSPQDYYFAVANRRTVAVSADMVDGEPGTAARYPSVSYWAGPDDLQDASATELGGTVEGDTTLHVALADVPAGHQVVLVSDTTTPVLIGAVAGDGTFASDVDVAAPADGEDWYVVVACPGDDTDCGSSETYDIVTAPIWVRAEPEVVLPVQPTPVRTLAAALSRLLSL